MHPSPNIQELPDVYEVENRAFDPERRIEALVANPAEMLANARGRATGRRATVTRRWETPLRRRLPPGSGVWRVGGAQSHQVTTSTALRLIS